jgi:hypothetical protein
MVCLVAVSILTNVVGLEETCQWMPVHWHRQVIRGWRIFRKVGP